MSNMLISKSTLRKQYGKIKDVVPVPNLIEIQSTSFNDFVQLDVVNLLVLKVVTSGVVLLVINQIVRVYHRIKRVRIVKQKQRGILLVLIVWCVALFIRL